ncbi:MAG: hypothetical protein RML46_08390 [Anaerolineae bacterium]|nr:hypothetical protein [Anaerolineae bacterium]MDW8068916.1 hypothetical protein [Anaerolineae bacterium]
MNAADDHLARFRVTPYPYWALAAILLLGASLRWHPIGSLSDMLSYDEAYYGLDTLSLIESPRLTPFLPANLGRQSLWCYILIPFVALFGAHPFALRVAAGFVGILTATAVYRLGRETLSPGAARWALLAFCVAGWPVHQSGLGMRAILWPLVGTLAFAALLQARRTGRTTLWIEAGLWIGMLWYTYFSALLWLLYAVLLLIGWLFGKRGPRRGGLIALGVSALVSLPMLVYGYHHPQEVLGRPQGVRVSGLADLMATLRAWARVWFSPADDPGRYNPLCPVVDAGLAAFFVIGLFALSWAVRQRWQAVWLLGLVPVSLLPSLLSRDAPHFLRAAGLTVPIALMVGAGAWGVEQLLRRIRLKPLATLFPLALMLLTALLTVLNTTRWLRHPYVFLLMEQHVNQGANFIRSAVPEDTPVYFSPFYPSHPVIAFRRADLAPRPVGAFDSHLCMVVPEQPAVYLSVILYEPDFPEKLSRWAGTTVLFQDPGARPPRYAVLEAVPKPEFPQNLGVVRAVFGGQVEVRLMEPLPSAARVGETVPIYLALRAQRPLDRAYSLFVHLYGDPTPYEGGPLWAQADGPACGPYTSDLWRTEEWILTTFSLTLPGDLPSGRYQVGMGIYDSTTGIRLALPGHTHDFLSLQQVEIRR